jgi:hypothetical protein
MNEEIIKYYVSLLGDVSLCAFYVYIFAFLATFYAGQSGRAVWGVSWPLYTGCWVRIASSALFVRVFLRSAVLCTQRS